MVRRYVAGTAAGAALLVSVAGCSGDSGDGKGASGAGGVPVSAVAAIALTSQKTARVDTFKATMEVNGSFGGQTGDANADIQARVRPTVGLNVNIKNIQAAGISVGSVQEVLTGDAVYLKMPMLSQASGGKPWVKFSLSQLGAHSDIDVKQMLSQAQQADPATTVKMFTASTDARKVGSEDINGVSTTHYQGTFNMRTALTKLTAKQRTDAQKMFSQAGLGTMNFDLWADGQSLPRKLVLTAPPSSATQLKMTVNYTDFNTKVNISAPPADQVSSGTLPGAKPGGGTGMPG